MRAAAEHDPSMLKELIYTERRVAVYLLFISIFSSPRGIAGVNSSRGSSTIVQQPRQLLLQAKEVLMSGGHL
jgi:hypothetical protein